MNTYITFPDGSYTKQKKIDHKINMFEDPEESSKSSAFDEIIQLESGGMY